MSKAPFVKRGLPEIDTREIQKKLGIAVRGVYAETDPAPAPAPGTAAVNPQQEIRTLATDLKTVTDGLKAFAEKAEKDIKAHGDITNEVKAKADELFTVQGELKNRITDLEQRAARSPGRDQPEAHTLGEMVLASDDVKDFMKRKPKNSTVKFDVEASITSLPNSGGDLVRPDRRPGIITPGERRMTIRQLLMAGRTASNSVEFVKETGFTNSAAPVSEGTLKPESDITFELENANVRTIAHWVHATRQILDDAPMLQSYIDGRLRYGLEYEEEIQLLLGDGTGQNLHGIVPQATAYSPAFQPDLVQALDDLRLGALQVQLAEYDASAYVLHPTDWAKIELTKDQEGRYIIGNPGSSISPRIWSRPVVATQAMTEGEFLTGAFDMAAQIFDREETSVAVSTEDRDNFVKNMVTVLAEERLAMAVYRPEAFVTGPFTASGSGS